MILIGALTGVPVIWVPSYREYTVTATQTAKLQLATVVHYLVINKIQFYLIRKHILDVFWFVGSSEPIEIKTFNVDQIENYFLILDFPSLVTLSRLLSLM